MVPPPTLQQRGPEIGVEEMQPVQVCSVLFERVPTSRLESGTQGGMQNDQRGERE
jgi:hypothetical protein